VILRECVFDRTSGCWMIRQNSCLHENYPPVKNKVRVENFRNNIFWMEKEDGGLMLMLDYFEDPNVIIPNWLLNRITQVIIPDYLGKYVDKAIEYHKEREEKVD